MTVKQHFPICPSGQIAELGKVPFNVQYRGETRQAILVRFKGGGLCIP